MKDSKETFEQKLRVKETVMLYPDGNINRPQRKAISELRSQGIIFVPVGDFFYKRIEIADRADVDKYINTQLASWRTFYFNTIKPIQKYMNKEQLDILHGGGLFETMETE